MTECGEYPEPYRETEKTIRLRCSDGIETNGGRLGFEARHEIVARHDPCEERPQHICRAERW